MKFMPHNVKETVNMSLNGNRQSVAERTDYVLKLK